MYKKKKWGFYMVCMRFYTKKDLNSLHKIFEREGWCKFQKIKNGFEIADCEHWANLSDKDLLEEFERLKKLLNAKGKLIK